MSAPANTWRDVPELGTTLGLRLIISACKLLGRRPARAFVSMLAFYYALASANARRSSREYLRNMGLPHGFRAILAHVRSFAHTALDRVFFVQDEFSAFEIHYHGEEHLRQLLADGRGAILLGAHVGSFEVMRAQASTRDIAINVVGDFRNAQRVNAALHEINPNLNTRLLQITPGRVDLALRLRELIERGELVAILGDRVGEGKRVSVEFLGELAQFPAGPYLLAAVIDCPIYFTVSLYTPPNRYDLYCEPFAERLELPRGARQEALAAYVQRYAARLEHYCRLAPNNWFNFFPFWQPDTRAALPPDPQPAEPPNEATISR